MSPTLVRNDRGRFSTFDAMCFYMEHRRKTCKVVLGLQVFGVRKMEIIVRQFKIAENVYVDVPENYLFLNQ